jgi:hypothetical protein
MLDYLGDLVRDSIYGIARFFNNISNGSYAKKKVGAITPASVVPPPPSTEEEDERVKLDIALRNSEQTSEAEERKRREEFEKDTKEAKKISKPTIGDYIISFFRKKTPPSFTSHNDGLGNDEAIRLAIAESLKDLSQNPKNLTEVSRNNQQKTYEDDYSDPWRTQVEREMGTKIGIGSNPCPNPRYPRASGLGTGPKSYWV